MAETEEPQPAPAYSMVGFMGVLSLDLFTVMPIGCTIYLNHDHYLLMRTLIPVVILCASFSVRWRLLAAAKGKVTLEASGGVNLDTVRGIAETGVDVISVGALTHSAPNFDIGLDES